MAEAELIVFLQRFIVAAMMRNSIGLGLMSGTSLDGLDMALCDFQMVENQWKYRVLYGETVPIPDDLRKALSEAENLSGLQLMALDRNFGRWMAQQVNVALDKMPARPDFIASHGQTIFHQPQNGLTVQIGSGAELAALTGITAVCDFRTVDVALGGQGAPLVPIGDQLLFNQYDACLNLGGFCNISLEENGQRVAFDIAPCNMLLNSLAQLMGRPYDKGGAIAREGFIYRPLLQQLNALDFYERTGAKSLGKEWFVANILPILKQHAVFVGDQLRTCTEHIAMQIANVLNDRKIKSVLVTGGGSKNAYLMDRVRALASDTMVVIPDDATVDFKEAIIFAFLGLRRLSNLSNCLKTATGAASDNCGGAVYLGADAIC